MLPEIFPGGERFTLFAIVPAAGSGTRMGEILAGRSKTLLALPGGQTILGLTLRSLAHSAILRGIVVVSRDEDLAEVRSAAEESVSEIPLIIVRGGINRQQSVLFGLQAVPAGVRHVVIHDAARPFCSAELIAKVAAVGVETGAAILALPAAETVKQVEGNKIVKTIDREPLWFAQTPQVFSLELILKAHKRAEAEGYVGTDDAELIERMGMRVSIVRGVRENIKITTPDDLKLAAALIQTAG